MAPGGGKTYTETLIIIPLFILTGQNSRKRIRR